MGDETEWIKLPADEKCVHKAWKARLAGYEEANKLFLAASGPKNPEFPKYLGILKKMVTDSNAIAQEKALEAVLTYVTNAAVAGKATGEVCTGVITKCLNASRAKTKERGIEILLMYIEIEKQEIVQEELIKGLANKQPKIVTACVSALSQALTEFGPKVMTVKPLVKQIQALLEHREKMVREEGKLMVIAIYKWIGAALKPQLASLKPVQITELEAMFENVAGEKVQQTRFLRSQQDLKAKFEERAAAGSEEDDDDEDGASQAVEIDPYELMDAVDIVSKLPKDFYDKTEAKKWQERKEGLDALLKLTEHPKIEQGDFNDIVRVLKRIIAKDANVMLVTTSAKCMAGLATGLRKKFAIHAPGCVEVALEKFREKKPTVVAALREAVDACYPATTLDAISEFCVASLEHKTPSVKTETAAFLARCFTSCTMQTLPKKLLKMFVAPLLKTANDTSPEVREASFTALGTAMKVVGEKPLMPFLADVDNLKMAKIKESCDKAEVVGKKAKKSEEGGAAAAKPASAKPAAAKPKTAAKKTSAGEPADHSQDKSAVVVRPKTAPSKAAGPGGKKKAGAKGKKGAGAEEVLEHVLGDDVVEEKAAALLPGDVVGNLASSNWKERLAAMETVTSTIKGTSKEDIPCQVCIRTICKKPGLKETNFQVMKLKVELIAHLGQNSTFSKTSATFCLSDLVDKVGDVKNGEAVKEALSCIAEAISLDYVSLEVVTAAFEQKNPKNQSEALNWLGKAVKEFGLKVNVKPMIETIKKALAATNPAIRTSAITLLGVLHMYMGPTIRVFFENEKAALLVQIDAEIKKVEGEKPPTPVRGIKQTEEADGEGEEADGEEEEGGAEGGINVADLVPRTDISDKITDDLITEMSDKNWKVRNEALQKVVAILNEAKFITANLGPLPEAIKIRLGDSNKVLVTATLNICQTLATAMGPNIKNHVRVVGPGIAACCGDSKPQVRANAVATVNAWVDQGGLPLWFEAEIFADELKRENPNLRIELLGWLAGKLPDAKKLPLPEVRLCLPHVLSCLEDRNGGVRTKAQEALVPFMIHTGYDSMVKAAGKMKPASKDLVMPHLEKAKGNLPAKPVKVKAPVAAKAAPAKVASARPAVEEVEEEEEEEEPERPATAPAKTNAKNKAKVVGKKAAPAAAGKKKKVEDVDLSPPLRVPTESKFTKEQRFKDEKLLRVLKWNFTNPRQEFVEQLQQQMEPNFNKTLVEQLWHTDFKNHVKALDTLIKACEDDIASTIANLDIILRWMTLRFFDTNTSVLLKGLEYLLILFTLLSENDYHLMEVEANSFIPYLVNKVGDPKENVRSQIRAIFKKICSIYPSSKMFSFIIDGIKSKNTKQKTECLEELGCQIETYGINVCQPSPAQALKLIAGQISIRDNSVRSAALNTIVAAYSILGETVYKYVGNLNDKDQGMLEERIKRSLKSKPAAPPSKSAPEEKKMVAKAPANQRQAQERAPQEHISRARPAKKGSRYQLELDDDEDEDFNVDPPNLIQIDVDEILNQPVNLPVIKSRRRPPSPSMRLLHTSSDTKSAIDLVISQVAGNDPTTSMQALHQIDEVLKDEEKSIAFIPHVDQLLMVCSLQLRMTCSRYSSADADEKETLIALLKCILGILLGVFQSKTLSREPSRDILKDLFFNLITILLDSNLNNFDEGPQVIRSVNVMVVKIVDKGDHTNVMRALIRLLHESVDSVTHSDKFLELIMKCLWKTVRMLPCVINDIQVNFIIGDLHQFMKAFPGSMWKTRSNETPLRTVKTILHAMVKHKGVKILNHLDQIDSSNSEVECYLRRTLKTLLDQDVIKNVVNNENEQMNGQTDAKRDKSKRLSKSTHDMLAEIFKKIGSKENTREGLNDLYDFKQQHPDADLDPFLKKSSQFFQNYIERGLKNIEMERQGKMRTPTGSSAEFGTGEVVPEEVSDGIKQHIEYLKTARAQWGLDNSELNTKLKQLNDLRAQSSAVAPGAENEDPTSEVPSIKHHVDYIREVRSQLGLDNSDFNAKFKHLDDSRSQQPLSSSQKLNGSSSSLSSNSSSGLPTSLTSSASNPENLSSAAAPPTDVSDLRRRLERIKNAARH